MTRLEELKLNLEIHQKSLKRLQDPNFRNKANVGKFYNPMFDFNPLVVIPSYLKIIRSIEEEIKHLSKRSNKKESKTQ